MRRSRSPASSYCSASGRDNSDWDVWAFKVKLRLRSGTPYLALEVSAVQKGSAFARDGYLHQSPRPAPGAALPMPLGQGLVDRRHDLLVGQHPIGVLHPRFVQILDLLGNQPVTKAALCPPGLNHGFFLARLGT